MNKSNNSNSNITKDNNNMYDNVKKYKVPSIQLPSSLKDKKRDRGDMGWDITNKKRKDSSYNNNEYKSLKEENILIMEERHKIMKSIKELASTTLTGINKKEYKEDKLTKLGAPPVPKQKIPFKMKMGLERGKEKRINKSIERAQASGVILPKGYLESLKNNKKEKKIDKTLSDAPNFDAPLKKGIFHLNKNKLDKRLISTQKLTKKMK
jgi:hypothetical protein